MQNVDLNVNLEERLLTLKHVILLMQNVDLNKKKATDETLEKCHSAHAECGFKPSVGNFKRKHRQVILLMQNVDLNDLPRDGSTAPKNVILLMQNVDLNKRSI